MRSSTKQHYSGSLKSPSLDRRSVVKAITGLGIASTIMPFGESLAFAQDGNDGLVQVSNGQTSTWIRNFNPLTPGSRWPTTQGIYEPLFIYNRATGESVPWLAESWEFSSDNLELTFHIREGVKWSDGTPFTAKDPEFTFNLLIENDSLSGSGGIRATLPVVKSVSAPDDKTFKVLFSEVFTPALYDIGGQTIVAQHVWAEVPDPVTFTNENPIGTGPLTEIAAFQNQYWELRKNPNYWQPGLPKIEGLKFPAFTSNDSANLATTNGENDWSGDFLPDIENTYVARDQEHFHYWFPLAGGSVILFLNTTKKPFDDLNVRKAISMGVDREQMVSIAVYDYSHPADASGMSDAYEGWKNESIMAEGADLVSHLPDKSNEMLDSAGLERDGNLRKDVDGNPMEYELIVPSGWSDWVQVCQIISKNLEDLGIKVNVKGVDEATWTNSTLTGEFDLSLGFTSDGATPFNYFRGMMASSFAAPVGTITPQNWHRYASQSMDTLLQDFAQTSDEEEQHEIADKMLKAFIDEWPAAPLYPAPQFGIYNTMRFEGFPSEDNPYAVLQPNSNDSLLVITAITPVANS